MRRHRFRVPWVLGLLFLAAPSLLSSDCNHNGLDDGEDIASGRSTDCNGNAFPDECDVRAKVDYGTALPPILAADLDGDGFPELLATGLRQLEVLANNGDGTFTRPDPPPAPATGLARPLAAGDLDGDGDTDLLVSIPGTGTRMIRNEGALALAEGAVLSDATTAAAALADLDDDGSLDVAALVQEPGGTLAVFLGDGAGSFAPPAEFAVGGEVALAAGDLDGDGRPDLITPRWLLLNRGGGLLAAPVPSGWESRGTASALAVADLDADGDLDFAVTQEKTLSVLWNRGDATFEPGSRPSTNSILHSLSTADIDDDGDLDLLTNWVPAFNRDNGVFSFGWWGTNLTGDYLLAEDLDADGDADVAVAAIGYLRVALNYLGPGFGKSQDEDLNGVPDECELSCREQSSWSVTNDFFFLASSDQGAPGDVVAVEILLDLDDPRTEISRIMAIGCYDGSKAELLERAHFTELWDQIAFLPEFFPFETNQFNKRVPDADLRGFQLTTYMLSGVMEPYLPAPEPLHLATLYFRLLGQPGDSFEVSFCDDVFARERFTGKDLQCLRNYLSYRRGGGFRRSHSTLHRPAEIRILPGPPTRPEPPPLPPLARVYDELPTPDTAEIVFELAGAVASPGQRDVPVEFFIRSNFEYTGFTVGITFPPEFLELSRVEEHIRPGAVKIDNQRGDLVLAMVNSRRRVGAEGERLKIATLHFDVLEAAAAVPEVELRFEPAGTPPIDSWLGIRHHAGIGADVPVTAEVAPLTIRNGRLLIRGQLDLFLRGDTNDDGSVNISDAQATLGFLFLGDRAPLCLDAADANDDGEINITDPIHTLQWLFVGGPGLPPPRDAPGPDPTPDALGCFGA